MKTISSSEWWGNYQNMKQTRSQQNRERLVVEHTVLFKNKTKETPSKIKTPKTKKLSWNKNPVII